MSFDIIADNIALYLDGALTTSALLLISLLLGLALALPLALLRSLQGSWISRLIWVYTYVFRGTPMLVQLFLIYYGLAQFEAVRESIFWQLLSSAWFCACLSFTLNTCAYTTEIIANEMQLLGGREGMSGPGGDDEGGGERAGDPGGHRRVGVGKAERDQS